MREFLFRAKPKNKSDYYFLKHTWKDNCKDGFVYGSLVVNNGDYYICVSIVTFLNCTVNNTSASMIEVLPETIGQYTGLTDENGIKIFEGDIVDVAYDINYGGIALERVGLFKVVFNNGCFMRRNEKGLFHFIPSDKCTVICDITDK